MKSGNYATGRRRDPYKLLLRIAGILVAVVAISTVVFLLCNSAVINDYRAQRNEIDQLNEEGEQEFNAQMNALRASVQYDC